MSGSAANDGAVNDSKVNGSKVNGSKVNGSAVSHAKPPAQPWLRGALALSGWLALAATELPDGVPPRWIPVLLFVLLGPGCALLLPLPRDPRPAARLEALALAAPLSLSLATLTATALFLVRGFSATVFLVSLAAFCTVVAPLPALPLPAVTRGAVERRPRRTKRSKRARHAERGEHVEHVERGAVHDR
ncbi:hypothetical protein [Streptomyces sp. 35G-GA-8]|uniref:hypothetical protein n=1 Tax=Streptomyces sp. 35G-GA-8 TaxID=2939434 RepID=UPI00201EA9CB|nr:hypothetical protein [Streptomyces sp. 35G-GA-8]MCL7380632.1 hypothetical protein [Streptomyces sp. 35G-GA-8]